MVFLNGVGLLIGMLFIDCFVFFVLIEFVVGDRKFLKKILKYEKIILLVEVKYCFISSCFLKVISDGLILDVEFI